MSKLRHWKERWDPKADLVFLRPMLVNGKQVQRGDEVTPDLRSLLGGRLKQWWVAGRLALKDGLTMASSAPALPAPVSLAPEPAPERAPARPRKAKKTKSKSRIETSVPEDLDGAVD